MRLREPVFINSLRLRNRIVMPPIGPWRLSGKPRRFSRSRFSFREGNALLPRWMKEGILFPKAWEEYVLFTGF